MESNSGRVERNESDDRFHGDRDKRPKLYDITQIGMLDSITNAITIPRNQPSMWISGYFASLRFFVYEVSSKPSLYLPPIHHPHNNIN